MTQKEIGEVIKGTQKQLWKEALFVKYDEKKIQPSFGSHTNQIPFQWNKGTTFNHYYNY